MGHSDVAKSCMDLQDSCSMKSLESLIKKPASYKNHENPTCTDLILTNRLGYFQHSIVFETGITNPQAATQFKMGLKRSYQKL